MNIKVNAQTRNFPMSYNASRSTAGAEVRPSDASVVRCFVVFRVL